MEQEFLKLEEIIQKAKIQNALCADEVKRMETPLQELNEALLLLKNKVEHWGDPHEYLNGKHIKDWADKIRTLMISVSDEDLALMAEHFSSLSEEGKAVLRNRSISNGTGN